jgi:hypothetical protein
MATYPIAIIEDRYQGAYSGGQWLAIACADAVDDGEVRIMRCLAYGPHGPDPLAMAFWMFPPPWIAAGKTPQEARTALLEKLVAAKSQSGAGDA